MFVVKVMGPSPQSVAVPFQNWSMAVKWASFQAFDQFGGEVERVDLYQVDKAGSGKLITSLPGTYGPQNVKPRQ